MEKVYIVNTSVMNGTVTMSVSNMGIKAETFEDAIDKVKKLKNAENFTHVQETKKYFSFNIKQKEGTAFGVHCFMENKPLEIV